jgi:voltage-gated potassium channel
MFFLLLVVLGTTGYVTVERWGLLDSAYMTVITLTAVGYSEVFPLSDNGRFFTMGLLGAGITWMGVWFALLTSFIVELDLAHVMRTRRISRRITNMKNHIIVCGAGRTGRQVINELEEMGAPWVAIERDTARMETLLGLYPEGSVLPEDANHDEALIHAGLKEARGLVACLSADRAGATHVVSPNVSGAIRMASVLLRPSVVSFLDIATRSSELALRMEQTEIREASPVNGRTLAEARIPQATGLIVIALKKAGQQEGHFVFNPVADTRLEAGDELIVLGTEEQIRRLRDFLRN